MKTKIKVILGSVLFVVGLAFTSGMVSGQEVTSRGVDASVIVSSSLGAGATATDVWSVQCGVGTTRINADIGDLGGVDGRRFTATVVDPRGRATSLTSPDGGLSVDFFLTGLVPGNYLLIITKSPAGTIESYDTEVRCETSAGALRTTNVLLVQNQ